MLILYVVKNNLLNMFPFHMVKIISCMLNGSYLRHFDKYGARITLNFLKLHIKTSGLFSDQF